MLTQEKADSFSFAPVCVQRSEPLHMSLKYSKFSHWQIRFYNRQILEHTWHGTILWRQDFGLYILRNSSMRLPLCSIVRANCVKSRVMNNDPKSSQGLTRIEN